MSEAKGQQEPSMEEILASIRRIISEDNDARPAEEAAPPPLRPVSEAKDDVLELTQVVDDTGSPLDAAPEAMEPEPPAAVMAEPEPIAQPGPAPEPLAALAPEPEMPPEVVAPAPLSEKSRSDSDMLASDNADRLISAETAASSSAAFADLANRTRERRSGDFFLGAGSLTVEEIVREEVRPLLAQWLDANLPALVERLVREEIQRVASGQSR
jgi:uncharacterized protein